MPKAYCVIFNRAPADPAKLPAFVRAIVPVFREAGARFIARGKPRKVYEAGLNERALIIEFESTARAIAALEDPRYKEAVRALGRADRDVRIIEGV